jgi:hypothetical protein
MKYIRGAQRIRKRKRIQDRFCQKESEVQVMKLSPRTQPGIKTKMIRGLKGAGDFVKNLGFWKRVIHLSVMEDSMDNEGSFDVTGMTADALT